MTIKEAVTIYNIKKEKIERVDNILKTIANKMKNYENPLKKEYTYKELEEIFYILIEYKEKLEKDLKEDFN